MFSIYAAEEYFSAALFLYAEMDFLVINMVAIMGYLYWLKILILFDYVKSLKENR